MLGLRVAPFLNSVARLFLPARCYHCSSFLLSHQKFLCSGCILSIPYAGLPGKEKSVLDDLFGIYPFVRGAAALWQYHNNSPIQTLIIAFKYGREKKVGDFLGEALASFLLHSFPHWTFDYIVPVPLSAKRLAERGFNQCEVIARKIEEIFRRSGREVKVIADAIVRRVHSASLSRSPLKARFQRDRERVFGVAKPKAIEGKKILLLDDVITTGSTIYSLLDALLDSPPAALYVSAVCTAHRSIVR